MESPTREYDPLNRPRFNEWVRISQADDSGAGGDRETMHSGADIPSARPSSGIWRIAVFAIALAIGLTGGFLAGQSVGYQKGSKAATATAKGEPADAIRLGQKVRAAIAGEPKLNDKARQGLIDVSIADQLTYVPGQPPRKSRNIVLTGHVDNSGLKNLATRVVKKAAETDGSIATVINELKIRGPAVPAANGPDEQQTGNEGL